MNTSAPEIEKVACKENLLELELIQLLNFATQFAGKDDIRKYLNQIHVNGNDIVAADGHKLLKITLPYRLQIMDRLTVKSIKNSYSVKQNLLEISEDYGKYPDYTRLIPATYKHERGLVCTNYLGNVFTALAKLQKEFKVKFPKVSLEQSAEQDAWVFKTIILSQKQVEIDITIIIMPGRSE